MRQPLAGLRPDARPHGTVYSHTVSYSVAMNFPGWEFDLPLVLGLIDLDDGARMYAQVTDCQPDDISIGMRVEVHCEDISAKAGIPKFRPFRTHSTKGSDHDASDSGTAHAAQGRDA